MGTFVRRAVAAALLDRGVYEEVEADRGANPQAVLMVLLASLATAIGLPGVDTLHVRELVVGGMASLLGWVAWALLTYTIGTRLLPEPQTRADFGQLLRTLAFAASPALLRVAGAVDGLALPVYAITSIWMLLAMVVAVRQALDYTSTARALGVCVIGWGLSLALVAAAGFFFGTPVS